MSKQKEVDRLVYQTTLEFLNERIELFTEYEKAATESGSGNAARYKSIVDSCQDIKESFLRLYRPEKKGKYKKSKEQNTARK